MFSRQVQILITFIHHLIPTPLLHYFFKVSFLCHITSNVVMLISSYTAGDTSQFFITCCKRIMRVEPLTNLLQVAGISGSTGVEGAEDPALFPDLSSSGYCCGSAGGIVPIAAEVGEAE